MSDELKIFINKTPKLNKECMNTFIKLFAKWTDKVVGLRVMSDFYKNQEVTPIILIKNKEDIYYNRLTTFTLTNLLKEFNKIYNIQPSFYDTICHILYKRINEVITCPLSNFYERTVIYYNDGYYFKDGIHIHPNDVNPSYCVIKCILEDDIENSIRSVFAKNHDEDTVNSLFGYNKYYEYEDIKKDVMDLVGILTFMNADLLNIVQAYLESG
jgi:hypothetical protein